MNEHILARHWYEIIMMGTLFFAALYFISGAINAVLIGFVFPYISYGSVLNPTPIALPQIRREIFLSSLSIIIFGCGLLIPWWLLLAGWAKLAGSPSTLQIVTEVLVLIVYNEIHFYVNHRLLHTRLLRHFHVLHHRSKIPTPWTTYSFHPLEAIMLGSVMLLPMLLHNFSLSALISFTIFSIVFNNIGHSNYDMLPDAKADRWWLNAARRHYLHHTYYSGNFGFMFPFMDRLFKTELPVDLKKL